MAIWRYPAVVRDEGGEFVVTFPDVPEAVTGAATEPEARLLAADALAAAVEGLLAAGRPLPPPREAGDGEFDVALDMPLAARAAIGEAMAAQGLSKVALAVRMNRDEKVVRRILAGQNASLALMGEALRALGVRPALAT